jgi:hypothetical protein
MLPVSMRVGSFSAAQLLAELRDDLKQSFGVYAEAVLMCLLRHCRHAMTTQQLRDRIRALHLAFDRLPV